MNHPGQNYTIQPAKNHLITSPAPAPIITMTNLYMIFNTLLDSIHHTDKKRHGLPINVQTPHLQIHADNIVSIISAYYFINFSGMERAFHNIQ
jgi:hypothetical protein